MSVRKSSKVRCSNKIFGGLIIRKRKILVIDDNGDELHYMKELIEGNFPHEALTAATCSDAIYGYLRCLFSKSRRRN